MGIAAAVAVVVVGSVLLDPTPTGQVEVGLGAPTLGPATPTPTTAPTVTPTSTPLPPTATPMPTPVPILTARLSFSGDVLSHSGVYGQALQNGNEIGDADFGYDYRPMFAQVQERLSQADLAICVLETPVSADNIGLSGYPTFNAPRELPAALKAVGFDGCSTASNHSWDRGRDGVVATLTEMDQVGLGHAGMARTQQEALTPKIYDVNGISIAHLSWTYGLNGFVLPADEPWLVNVTNVDGILADADRARDAGADVVILSIQWGNEYVTDPTANQLELADTFTASADIDMIVGNHAHVIQPIDTVNGKLVVYGLGNFLSNQSGECCPARSQDGVMIEIVITGTDVDGYSVTEVAAVPTWVDRSSYTIVPAASGQDARPELQDALATSLERTAATLTRLGAQVTIE